MSNPAGTGGIALKALEDVTMAPAVKQEQHDPMEKYDPNIIKRAAEAKRDAGDTSGAQMLYQSALLDWVDDAREGTDLGLDPAKMREAVATLWIDYANLNRSANSNKAALEAFEAAVNCPVAGSVGRIWLEYARFQRGTEKYKSAQKVYLRALVGDDTSGAGVTDEKDHQVLWDDFLSMMRTVNQNPSLSLEELRTAVEQEHVAKLKRNQPGTDLSGSSANTSQFETTTPSSGNGQPPPAKRAKVDEVSGVSGPGQTSMIAQQHSAENSNVHMVTAKAIEDETIALLNSSQTMPPEITAAWLVRDADTPPSQPEPPLFSPSPPKLADPSGSELLGVELALKLIRMLLKKSDMDKCGTIVLEVCRGCWMMTALQEREAARIIDSLDHRMGAEMDALEAKLEERLSVAGAASSAVQQMNDNERSEFFSSCNQQRQQLIDFIAWEFRKLLAAQQQILTKLNIPCFEGPTVDASAIELQAKVSSFLHSAFYLRSRIGEEQHLVMLKSQEARLSAKKTAPPPPPPPPPPLPVPTKQNANNRNSPIPPAPQGPPYFQVPPPPAGFQAPLFQHGQPLQTHATQFPVYQQPTQMQPFQQINPQQMMHIFQTQQAQPQMFPPQPNVVPGSTIYPPMVPAPNLPVQSIPPSVPPTFQQPSQQQQHQMHGSRRTQGKKQPRFSNQRKFRS